MGKAARAGMVGELITPADGAEVAKFSQEHIFGSLGMKNTGYAHDDSGLAVSYLNSMAPRDRVPALAVHECLTNTRMTASAIRVFV